VIDLTGPPRPWSARLVARFAAAQQRSLRSRSWWQSPAPRGEPELLDRLAELFGSPPGRTVVTGGVRQFATSWAIRTTRAVVEMPTYSDIPEILGAGAAVRSIPWSALRDGRLTGTPPGTIWLTDPFRNPDGRSLDRPLAAAVDELVRRGHTAVINQVYRWFGPVDTSAPTAPAGAWTVTSLAKVAGGGIRLGWATAPTEEAITRTLTSVGPPTAWQRACAAFLDDQTLRALRSDCVEPTLVARRAFVSRAAELRGWDTPGGGPSLMLDCVDMSEAAGVALLAANGLKASPGSAFGSTVPSVRLAFSGATTSEATAAAETIGRLGRAFGPTSFQ
jgi:DNA-binding transcriptional MocR family regulator